MVTKLNVTCIVACTILYTLRVGEAGFDSWPGQSHLDWQYKKLWVMLEVSDEWCGKLVVRDRVGLGLGLG